LVSLLLCEVQQVRATLIYISTALAAQIYRY